MGQTLRGPLTAHWRRAAQASSPRQAGSVIAYRVGVSAYGMLPSALLVSASALTPLVIDGLIARVDIALRRLADESDRSRSAIDYRRNRLRVRVSAYGISHQWLRRPRKRLRSGPDHTVFRTSG
jgi:hypothetical protein